MSKPTSLYAAYQQVVQASRNPQSIKCEDGNFGMWHGQGGPSTDRFRPRRENLDDSKRLNNRYKGEVVNPFYDEKKWIRGKSGVFSTDEGAVLAALEHGVKTNKAVQSKIIPLGYYEIGLFKDSPSIDVGMVDALCWQCLLGCERNVKLILGYGHGYDVPKRYSGLNPITAAIRSKNLQVLKYVLAYLPIREIVNDKDGFGTRPIQAAASVSGIDPYEFARDLIRAGANDTGYDGEYSAAMMSVLRDCAGSIWTPNVFGELLSVTDVGYKAKDGETVETLAEKNGNRDALRMIGNFRKFGKESLNDAVLDGSLN